MVATQSNQSSLGLKTRHSSIAMLSCIHESLLAIETANRTFDQEGRRIAIVEYKHNQRRALASGLTHNYITARCRKLLLRCLAANLQGIAVATVIGDYHQRVDTLIDWYEEDRDRMIKLGFPETTIDEKMTKLKIKLACR